jgi:DNA (cytosine-5)-methyltransferase 1
VLLLKTPGPPRAGNDGGRGSGDVNNDHCPRRSLLDGVRPKNQGFGEMCAAMGCDGRASGWPDRFGESISATVENAPPISTLSLFSGAGGLDAGFADAGFDIVKCVEQSGVFCETLRKNSGQSKPLGDAAVCRTDINDFMPDDDIDVDFIIGGPPCQTFSAAGRRANGVIGTGDARGRLFKQYVRILKHYNPKGFLFENVYGIIGAERGEPWREIVSEFTDAGFTLSYRILDAADYGVPQHRERLIIVGLKDKEFKFPKPTHGPDSADGSKYYNSGLAIDSVIKCNTANDEPIRGRYGHLLNDIPPGLNYSFYTEEMGHPQPIFAWRSKFSDFLYKADPEMPVRTIKAQGGQCTGPFHWENRRFSIEEYKRLQTFPDKYIICGSKTNQIHQIGNSVPPQLARILAISIRNQVFGFEFPFQITYIPKDLELGFRSRKRLLTQIYQDKAKSAISNWQKPDKIPKQELKNYTASITDQFDFFETTEKQNNGFNVFLRFTSDLEIYLLNIKHNIDDITNLRQYYSITIRPNKNNTWVLEYDKITAYNYSTNKLSYTALWKAIDKELKDCFLKADLVQLYGYYQYKPRINCEFNCDNNNELAFLIPVVNGKLTRKLTNIKDLAFLWNLSKDDVVNKAIIMRKLGYEIRNHNTNPQISKNDWLIPYPFPTLTPLSVQLRKSIT